MTLEDVTRRANAGMVAFDLALGTGALLAPHTTLAALGHAPPSPDAETLFRRCGPIWLTYAAAHLVAARRDRPEDWWALAWLRGTEWFTDLVWSRSPAVGRRGAASLYLATAGNLAMSLAFARLSRDRRRGRGPRMRRSRRTPS
jgi:hypothetical protein